MPGARDLRLRKAAQSPLVRRAAEPANRAADRHRRGGDRARLQALQRGRRTAGDGECCDRMLAARGLRDRRGTSLSLFGAGAGGKDPLNLVRLALGTFGLRTCTHKNGLSPHGCTHNIWAGRRYCNADVLCPGGPQPLVHSRVRWSVCAGVSLWLHARRLALRDYRSHLGGCCGAPLAN